MSLDDACKGVHTCYMEDEKKFEEARENKLYKCEYCNDWFKLPEEIFEHIKKFHHKDIVGYCRFCKEQFFDFKQLNEHMQIHVNEKPKEAKRTLVKFNYNALDPEFLFMLAEVAYIADEKYGDWEQYKDVRLKGNQSPISHIYHHLGNYRSGADYENLNGEFKRKKVFHLAAVAYNAMMEAWYCLNIDNMEELEDL